jgi:hypothetical protein
LYGVIAGAGGEADIRLRAQVGIADYRELHFFSSLRLSRETPMRADALAWGVWL